MAYSHQLDRVIKLIGPQATIRLSRQYGGRDYHVPRPENLHDMHPLVVMIGLACADSLSREFGGGSLRLPIEVSALIQIRNAHILQCYQTGQSVSSIARGLSVDRKLVQKVLDQFHARGKLSEPESQAQLL